jgi:hypothetical protein
MAFEAVEGALVPTEFVAVIVKVYESPSVSPVTVQERAPEVQVHVWPPLAAEVESTAVTV